MVYAENRFYHYKSATSYFDNTLFPKILLITGLKIAALFEIMKW